MQNEKDPTSIPVEDDMAGLSEAEVAEELRLMAERAERVRLRVLNLLPPQPTQPVEETKGPNGP